jgi:hypothetical protein
MLSGSDRTQVHPILHYDVLRARTLDNSQFFADPSDFAECLSQNFPQIVETKHSKHLSKFSNAMRRSKRRAKSASVFYDDDLH